MASSKQFLGIISVVYKFYKIFPSSYLCLYTVHIKPLTAPEYSTFPRAESHHSFQAAF